MRFLDTREGPIPEEDEGRAFNQRPVPHRIAVLLAGPFFNFLFAIIAYWALFVYGIPTLVPAVGGVEPGSYAAEAGLQQGDRIVAVGGQDQRPGMAGPAQDDEGAHAAFLVRSRGGPLGSAGLGLDRLAALSARGFPGGGERL